MSTLVVQNQYDIEVNRTSSIMSSASIVGPTSLVPALPFGLYVQYNSGLSSSNPMKVRRSDGTWGFVVDITGRYIFSGGVWIYLGP